MDLRGEEVLDAYGSWVDGPDGCNRFGSNTARQVVQEVVKLENLIGGSHNVVPLGK